MKIIFLDIDGVLNSNDYFDKQKENSKAANICFDMIDLEAVKRLQHIVDTTGAKIVLSSTWRFNYFDKLKAFFRENGFTFEIIDRTGRGCSDCVRGNEIRKWLKDNVKQGGPEVEKVNYCILDDDSDMLLWQEDYFVHTDNKHGLTDDDAVLAIRILNDKPATYF